MYRRPIDNWRRDVLGLPPAKGEERLCGKAVTRLYAYSQAVVPRPSDWDESSVVTGYWFLDTPASWRPDPSLVEFLNADPEPVLSGLAVCLCTVGRKKRVSPQGFAAFGSARYPGSRMGRAHRAECPPGHLYLECRPARLAPVASIRRGSSWRRGHHRGDPAGRQTGCDLPICGRPALLGPARRDAWRWPVPTSPAENDRREAGGRHPHGGDGSPHVPECGCPGWDDPRRNRR
jgi:hypothetical protein